MSTINSASAPSSKLSQVAKKIARSKAVLNKNLSLLTTAASFRSNSASATIEAKVVSTNDIGPIRTFKRRQVRNSSISDRSILSNSSSMRSTSRLSLDRETAR